MYRKPIVLIALIVVLGAGAKLYSYHTNAVAEAKRSVVQEYDREYVRGLEDQLALSQALHESALKANKELSDEKSIISDKHAALVNSVRKRPSREDGIQQIDNTSSCPPPANTGASLYREDGEFLAGEAAAAEVIMRERDMYYNEYNKLKKELDKLNGKD